ncbi:unnamed protein product [Meganyctiphanes norvegica]|uniref:Uncharacterized protein n=1 Tax=Meganyctiphanes norvegica TaxID=48144 RepID=A0AAV2QU84_MEGNR
MMTVTEKAESDACPDGKEVRAFCRVQDVSVHGMWGIYCILPLLSVQLISLQFGLHTAIKFGRNSPTDNLINRSMINTNQKIMKMVNPAKMGWHILGELGQHLVAQCLNLAVLSDLTFHHSKITTENVNKQLHNGSNTLVGIVSSLRGYAILWSLQKNPL